MARVDLDKRRDLLSAVMKSPGPFYEPAEGGFPPAPAAPEEEDYLRALEGVRTYEARRGVDFEAAKRACLGLLDAES